MDSSTGMSDREITLIALKHTPSNMYFGGVYPCDLVPSAPHRFLPIYYIVNTSKNHTEGTHWLLFFINTIDKRSVWFDPLGTKLDNYSTILSKYVQENMIPYETNKFPVQTQTSSQCGQFCLSVSDMMCHEIKFEQIMNMFSAEPSEHNELFVSKYVRTHMLQTNQVLTQTNSMVSPIITKTYKNQRLSSFPQRKKHHHSQHRPHIDKSAQKDFRSGIGSQVKLLSLPRHHNLSWLSNQGKQRTRRFDRDPKTRKRTH